MSTYFGVHNHTEYSNLRLLDCINRPDALIKTAQELGLNGLAITDHETLSAHMIVNKIAKALREVDPNFTIALGNEIYLTDTREPKQKYYHFILIAKDEEGYKQLKELSTIAWLNGYETARMERVPTLKSELEEIILKNPGHVIATSACIGGELSTNALLMAQCQKVNDINNAQIYYDNINNFLSFCKKIFGEDFYIECAPSTDEDQIIVNQKLFDIAQARDLKMVIGTDAHYLRPEDRPIHKAYLTSKDGERETDTFYKYTYLMSPEEVHELMSYSFDNSDIVEWMFYNSRELQNKIKWFSLERKQIIPKVNVKDYPKLAWWGTNNDYADDFGPNGCYHTLGSLFVSDEIQERAWINNVWNALEKKIGFWGEHEEYVARLEIEADIIRDIGNKLNDCLFAYFNTFQHYINLFWECGSIVGPGRGSATGFLSNYLLGITQLDPIRWNLPYWRFLNKERAELPDIDIDLAPSKRPLIFEKIREERGQLGLAQVVTFGTEATKAAIQTACRGYRSEEYPEGIDVDEAIYMSGLIPQERGFLWDIEDVVHGNEERDRKPVKAFLDEVSKYPGLLDIIICINGLVNKRGVHASGVILYGEDPYDTASFMRAPGGDIVTCWDLHEAEAAGDTKYDFLVTEASDKIIQCYELLKKGKEIPDVTLREFYDKWLHPEVMDVDQQILWDHLAAGDILDIFQFATGVGLMIAKKLKPQNMLEMTAASALMRLMAEKGKESPQDRYVRIQKNPSTFENEMIKHGLTEKEREAFHKHCDTYYGTVPLQEQMMEILMDENIANFTLAEANSARKIVAKKQMKKIPELRKQLYEHVNNDSYADYIWEIAVAPSLGYAFSKNHSLPYSFVGIQMDYLATTFNPIYWDTACLIVNSGAVDPENSGSTNYGKIARAIGAVKSKGIEVSLVDINASEFGFAPDIKNNRILLGLKNLLNVGDDVIESLIKNRIFESPKDFYYKVKPNKRAMISLIKAGAFDSMEERKFVMAWFIWETCDKKSRLTLQNMPSLLKYNIVPLEDEKMQLGKRIYEFNRYLKAICKGNEDYWLDERALNFLSEIGKDELVETFPEFHMNIKKWDKVYQKEMDVFRNWIAADKDNILFKLNSKIFKEDWDRYALGTYSSWEMEVACFYYHEHELTNMNTALYGISDFFELPEDPTVDKYWKRGGKEIPLFKLTKIAGTCIDKNKAKSTVTLLTTTGVVEVKFRKEYFALFDKQISERGEDGKKHVIERSWFNRGNMIIVNGMRSGDNFICKKYASTAGHQLYKINKINNDGTVLLQDGRYQGGIEEEDGLV